MTSANGETDAGQCPCDGLIEIPALTCAHYRVFVGCLGTNLVVFWLSVSYIPGIQTTPTRLPTVKKVKPTRFFTFNK